MTRWPTTVEIQVCTTPSALVRAATPTMPATSQISRVRSAPGSASSMTARSRNGWAIATTEEAAMIAVTIVTDQRWPANSPAMRRSETLLACAFSAAVTVGARPLRPPVDGLSK
jgi:hypothetical protein